LHTSGAVGARIGGLSAPQLALHDLSIWALPFFLATAGYFHAAGAPAGGRPASWLGRRLARLAVPFLAFTALYRAYALHHFHERYSWFLLRHDLIYGTASAHLWFLPVLIWCSVIVWLVERTEWNGARGALLGVSAAGAVAYMVIAADAAPGAAYGYYLYRTPLFWLLFYVLGWELARRRGENAGQSGGRPAVRGAAPADGRPAARVAPPAPSAARFAERASAVWTWLALAAGAACLVASRLPGPAQVVALYYVGAGLAGVAAAALAVRRPGRRLGRLVRTLAAATLGFYLLHFFVLDLFLTYVPLSGWRYGSGLYELIAFAAVALVTAGVVVAARCWRPLRWVFG